MGELFSQVRPRESAAKTPTLRCGSRSPTFLNRHYCSVVKGVDSVRMGVSLTGQGWDPGMPGLVKCWLSQSLSESAGAAAAPYLHTASTLPCSCQKGLGLSKDGTGG